MNGENKRIENLFLGYTENEENRRNDYSYMWLSDTQHSPLTNLTITINDDSKYKFRTICKDGYDFSKFDLTLIVKKPIDMVFVNCNFKSLIIRTEDQGRVNDLLIKNCQFLGNVQFKINCYNIVFEKNSFNGDSLIIDAKDNLQHKGSKYQIPFRLVESKFGTIESNGFNLEININENSPGSLNFSDFNCKSLNLKISLKNLDIYIGSNVKITELKIEGFENNILPDLIFRHSNGDKLKIQEINFRNLGNIKLLQYDGSNLGKIHFTNIQFIDDCKFSGATISGDILGYRKISDDEFEKNRLDIYTKNGISRFHHNLIFLKKSYLLSQSIFINCTFENFNCNYIFLKISGIYTKIKNCSLGDVGFYADGKDEYQLLDFFIDSSSINLIEISLNTTSPKFSKIICQNTKIGMTHRKKLNDPPDISLSGLFLKNCNKLIIKNSEIFDCELMNCEFQDINFEEIKFHEPLKIMNSKSSSHNVEFRKLQFADNNSSHAIGSFRALTKFCQDAGYEVGAIYFHKKELETRHNSIKKNPEYDFKVERFLLLFSKLFSNYGNSLFRPLMLIFLIFLIAFFLLTIFDLSNYFNSKWFDNLKFFVNGDNLRLLFKFDNLKLCLRNAFIPFYYALPKDFVDVKYLESLNRFSNILSFIQAVVSAIIWTIWVFMVRRRFRIG